MPGNSSGKTEAVHWAWVILAVCFVNLFINYAIRLGYGTILPEMIRTMGITRKDGGQIFNAYFYAYIVFSPFVGYLTDRLGARVVIPAFGLVLGLGTLFMGSAQSFWGAAIPFLFVGIGAAAMWTPDNNARAAMVCPAQAGNGPRDTVGRVRPGVRRDRQTLSRYRLPLELALLLVYLRYSRPVYDRDKYYSFAEQAGRYGPAALGHKGGRAGFAPPPAVKQQSCYGEILSAKDSGSSRPRIFPSVQPCI